MHAAARRTGGTNVVGSLALLLARVVLGGIFAVHGYTKLFGGPGKTVSHPVAARFLGNGFGEMLSGGGIPAVTEGFRRMGIPAAGVAAPFVALLEFGGGILVILGWLTRSLAVLLAADMVEAIRRVHWRNGLLGPGGFALPLALFAGCLELIGAGPGKLSLDELAPAKPTLASRELPLAGGLVVPLAVAFLIGAVVVWLGRRRRRIETIEVEPATAASAPAPEMAPVTTH
jgi:putative oxidoreductase